MFDNTADFRVAVGEFENIFHQADKKIQKELWALFVRGYKEGYRYAREVLKEDSEIEFYKKTVILLDRCQNNLNRELKEPAQKDEVLYFGRAMGGIICYF